MPITLNGDTGILTPMYNGAISSNAITPVVGMKNKIINGAMVIDQRNAGASVSGDAVYPVDRFRTSVSTGTQTFQRSTVAPIGFVNSTLWTVTASGTPSASNQNRIQQIIEGSNIFDLGWGTANAQTVTLSFWIRSSLTGTFSGCLMNGAYNRSYVFTYAVNSTNTWEQKTITIAGDTTGTWTTDVGVGIRVCFDGGSGSNFNATANTWSAGEFYRTSGAVSLVANASATWYITGVQLEVGSTATSFDYRPYGTELQLCQRYYQKIAPTTQFNDMAFGFCDGTTTSLNGISFKVSMRTAPSALETTGTAANYAISHSGTNSPCSVVPSFASSTTETINVSATVTSGLTIGRGASLRSASGVTTAYLAWSAEL